MSFSCLLIRPACEGDAEAVVAVYAPYVRDTAVSFEADAPPVAVMAQRIAVSLDDPGSPTRNCWRRVEASVCSRERLGCPSYGRTAAAAVDSYYSCKVPFVVTAGRLSVSVAA